MFTKSLIVAVTMATILSAGVSDKTVVKRTHIDTNVNAQDINVKGKLNLGSVKIGEGTNIEDSDIRSNSNVGRVDVGQGGQADIGSVDIGH